MTATETSLHLWSVNGDLICQKQIDKLDKLYSIAFYEVFFLKLDSFCISEYYKIGLRKRSV